MALVLGRLLALLIPMAVLVVGHCRCPLVY
jgi:hypothetical protein